MRIFVVCSRLCTGGAERVGVVLANGFAEKGHEVYLLSNTNLDISYPIRASVHVVNIFPDTTNKIKKWIGATIQMRKEIKRYHPDVILGIEETCSLMAKMASIGQHTHVICTEHNSYQRPPSAPMGRMEWFMKYQMTKLYECVTVLTDADRDYIGSKLNNVVVMPNPLAIKPVGVIPEKRKVLLAAGRLDVWHYKGFDLLIRAWANVVSSLKLQVSKELEPETNLKPETISPWWLQIAGTGSKESLQYLKQLCKENGVEESVDFLGFRTDIEELYKQSEIFVLSSRYEGFGLVLIEAMSQGCACVACDYHGRQKEIICPNGANESFKFFAEQSGKAERQVSSFNDSGVEVCENGILCEVESVEALAEGIKRMMEDEEYRKEVQRNSVERSKAYSVDRIVQRWENLFDQIVY
jgi:glycosyltransferase involved in cell wall biosynthesis